MTEATKIDKNSGTWTVEYHYGNGTNTIDIHKNIGTHTEAIKKALECFINSGKHGYPESMREEVRAHLFRFGYYGDGNTSYEDEHRGLTRVEVSSTNSSNASATITYSVSANGVVYPNLSGSTAFSSTGNCPKN